MALRTKEEYKASIKAMRTNIYKFGQAISDPTTDDATKNTIEGHGNLYQKALEEKTCDLLTTTSQLTGEPISRYLSIIRTADDMIANCHLKRFAFQLTGTCTGGRCVGWTAINSMFVTTYDCDKETGSDYHQRLLNWLAIAQTKDITIAGALTDPKGDRTKSPSQQDDPDMNLHIVEKRPDGIVVRGAKVMICGVAAANEIFILPGSMYGPDDTDYAVSFVIPRDTENLTIVEARHPSDDRDGGDAASNFDSPNKQGGITQAYLFFEDVFVPHDRIFMCGEYKFTKDAIFNFIGPYRSAIGGCVAGQGDVKVGAAILTARANGLSAKVFKDKISQMYVNNETTFGVGIAASVLGKKHPSGAWQPDLLMANVNKIHVATLPYDTNRLAQDISGGIAETGCMPSALDFQSEQYGHLVKKYMKAVASGESRARAARLVEWTTIGAGVPGCMHGGGSPDGARLVINALSNLEEKVANATRLAGITEEIPEPRKKKVTGDPNHN